MYQKSIKLAVVVLFVGTAIPLPSLADRILVVGDSHTCGDFGKQLMTKLSEGGKHSVVVYCAPGLSVQHWTKGFTPTRELNFCKTFSTKDSHQVNCLPGGKLPALAEIISKEKPDIVVPALGTNNLGLNALDKFSEFVGVVKKSAAKCWWIGPPTLGAKGKMCENLRQNFGRLISTIQSSVTPTCTYIDSLKSTDAQTTPDCLHRFGEPARRWANGVAQPILSRPQGSKFEETTDGQGRPD